MNAPNGIGVNVSWPRVTAVFVLAVAGAAVATNWPGDPRAVRIAEWVSVALTVLMLIAVLITYRRVALGVLMLRWLGGRRRLAAWRPDPGAVTAIGHRHRYGQSVVGIRATGGHLVSVIAVAAAPHQHALSGRPAGLPIALVAGGLRQFDICLAGIDIVSVAGRDEGPSGEPAGESEPAGSTWVVLRMDARRNLAGVVVRDSVASAFAAATERLAQLLAADGLTTRILDTDDIADVDATVLAGLRPEELRVRLNGIGYRSAQPPGVQVACGWLPPAELTSAGLERVLQTEADRSVLTMTLVPSENGARIAAVVRHHGDDAAELIRADCTPLTGRQLAAITASRPLPAAGPALVVPGRELAAGEELILPLMPLMPPVSAGAAPQPLTAADR